MKDTLRKAITPYIADLRDRKITGREVARRLGVTESWVSKVLKSLQIERNKKPSRDEKRQLREARQAHRIKAATTLSVAAAAEACNVHPRTITRLLKTLEK